MYQIREDGCHVIFDTDEGSGDYAVDALIEFDPTFLPYVPDLLEGKQIPALESNDSYGWLLTHYHPVLTQTENASAMLALIFPWCFFEHTD